MIAVEQRQVGAPVVAWLRHAGALTRPAPEYLRMATSLGTRTYDILVDPGLRSHRNMAGSRYVDLGVIPTASEPNERVIHSD